MTTTTVILGLSTQFTAIFICDSRYLMKLCASVEVVQNISVARLLIIIILIGFIFVLK